MSSKNILGNEAAVGEQAIEQGDARYEVVDETPELHASVEQEIQAKVDYANDWEVKGRLFGQTLEAEERAQAREWEIERTRVRFDRRQESDREERTRVEAARVSVERQYEFGKRAGCVDQWADPDVVDAREQLSRDELATVNREAARMVERLSGWSRAAISRRLAEEVVDGKGMMSAVVGVFEELQKALGQVIPIAAVGEVGRCEVSISGTVTQLWESSHPAVQQVGLIEDESGRTKFTVWTKSRKPMVREGEQVTMRNVAKSWYGGRVSVAVTGWSDVFFPEREAWWTE